MMDPARNFADDGGTPGWRARHQIIDVYPDRRAALKAYMRKHPMTWIFLGIWAGLLPFVVFAVGFALLVAYGVVHRVLFGTY